MNKLAFDTQVCQSKKAYATRKTARAGSKHIKRLKKVHQRPYRCRICKMYHLFTIKQGKANG